MSQVVMKWFSSLLSGHCYADWYGMEFVRDSGMNRIEITSVQLKNRSAEQRLFCWQACMAGMMIAPLLSP